MGVKQKPLKRLQRIGLNTQDNPERGRRLYASIQQSLADGILTFGGHNQELGT